MDDWLKQLQAALQTAARDSSDRFADVSKQTGQAVEEFVVPVVDQIVEGSVEALDQFEAAIAPTLAEFEEQVDTALDTSVVFFNEQVGPWIEETTAPITRTVNPWLQNHPSCIGCQHYHGTVYGEDMLVCGMHPYGPDKDGCPDWESVWTGPAEVGE